MITTAEIILAVLKLVNYVINYVGREKLMAAGRAEQIAIEAQAIAVKTAKRKIIMEQVDAMDEAEVDKELAGLVDPPARSGGS